MGIFFPEGKTDGCKKRFAAPVDFIQNNVPVCGNYLAKFARPEPSYAEFVFQKVIYGKKRSFPVAVPVIACCIPEGTVFAQ